jgi:hypothetical protein
VAADPLHRFEGLGVCTLRLLGGAGRYAGVPARPAHDLTAGFCCQPKRGAAPAAARIFFALPNVWVIRQAQIAVRAPCPASM